MGRLLIIMLSAFVADRAVAADRGDIAVSESAVGALATGYAWLAAATAFPLTLATRRLDRRDSS
jgi:predicted MFS family arabinose efflux permease